MVCLSYASITRWWLAITRDNISRRASICFGVIAGVAGELGVLGGAFFAGVAVNAVAVSHSMTRKIRNGIRLREVGHS